VAERVYIHIGAPKTGTTSLQQALYANRERMEEVGVLYAPERHDAHHSAVLDLRDAWQRENASHLRGAWKQVVRQVRQWDGPTAVLSSELFVYGSKQEAARALSAFGDAEVHVIYTARDLVRQVPAVWQERMKNQYTMPYGRFVQDVIGPARSPMARGFWSAQDAPEALKRWSKGLPSSHVHVVTAPPPGSSPALLWDRFLSVLGLEGAAYPADVSVLNPSLGAVEAEVLRRLNRRHGQDLGPGAYRMIVRNGLFDVLDHVVPDKIKITLRSDEHNALVAKGRQIADGIRRGGYDVVGDLADLVPPSRTPEDDADAARRPDDVRAAEMVNVLVDVVYALLEERRALKDSHVPRARRRRQRSLDRRASGDERP
jgi:hypothetical protein